MATIKEIRTRMKSVEQTLKITNAMYLISSSKLRRARQMLSDVQPYFQKITETISDILHHSPEIEHCFFDKRPHKKGAERKVGYVVITGDKGLAGAYNHNIIKLTEQLVAQTSGAIVFPVGQFGRNYFITHGVVEQDDESFLYTVQDPTTHRAMEMSEFLLGQFTRGELDEVYIIYTEMVSSVRLEPTVRKLLPLDVDAFPWKPRTPERYHQTGELDEVYIIYTEMVSSVRLEPTVRKLLPLDVDAFPWKPRTPERYHQTVEYVPSAKSVLSQLVPGYAKGILFGALVESFCSEQNARMTAMDSSTKNAREMLRALSLVYNRVRQSAITQEITEIVGGSQQKKQTPVPKKHENCVRVIHFDAAGNVLP